MAFEEATFFHCRIDLMKVMFVFQQKVYSGKNFTKQFAII